MQTKGEKMENKFILRIEIDENKTNHQASGTLNSGFVKLLIGEMELIKKRLLEDLEQSLESKENKFA